MNRVVQLLIQLTDRNEVSLALSRENKGAVMRPSSFPSPPSSTTTATATLQIIGVKKRPRPLLNSCFLFESRRQGRV